MNNDFLDNGHSPEKLSEREPWQNDFEEALELHQKGIQGNTEAVKQAYSILKRIRTTVPDNNLVEAYFGSITTLQGRDELDPLERIKKVNK